jgi:hypothetical protein
MNRLVNGTYAKKVAIEIENILFVGRFADPGPSFSPLAKRRSLAFLCHIAPGAQAVEWRAGDDLINARGRAAIKLPRNGVLIRSALWSV